MRFHVNKNVTTPCLRACSIAELFPLTEQLRTYIKYQQVQTGRGTGQRQTGSPSLADRVGLVTIL